MFKTRLISGIFLVLAVVLTIRCGGLVLFAALLGISLIGMQEILRAMNCTGSGMRRLEFAAYAGAVLYYLLILADVSEFGQMGLVIALAILLFVYVFSYPQYTAVQVFSAYFSVVYVAGMLSFLYLTRCMEDGWKPAVMIFLCSWGCDTCAYCVGMLIGKHKMSPLLSPKKSVEGAVGGVAGAALLGALFAWLVKEPVAACALICAAGALLSMVGDLAASAIKRNQGIKDYGKLIPGHGGILDRFDSVIITAPVIYYLARFLIR